MVGNGTQNAFVPQAVTANVGDNIVFMWGGGKHSVLLSSPPTGNCTPMPGTPPIAAAVDTAQAKNVTFAVTANMGAKAWWICGVPGHCQGGMFGVLTINGGAASNSTTGGATPSGAAAAPAASSGSNPTGGNGGSGTTGGNGGSGTTGGAAASPSDAKASNANKGGFSGALIIVSGLLMYFSGYLL
ncbi:16265_t:CDS:2 [Gigaspora margarita]|uniref:16265_t:CDS:1 n=1 Tax=Gigaspora margarita TaxID=4874 RepID=A0ABN7V4T6_GIGMA|nr:16265_t:CDS:2 [Gigaspora margarita]